MDEVIAKRVITDVVVVAEKGDCPKGYNLVPTKQSLNDTVETETGFEIGSGLDGRLRKRFICIAYGLEELDEQVLTDLKILDTCKKAPPQHTLLPKTRDTGEDVLQDKQMYLQKMKPSGYEWIIDSLVICPSTGSQAKRRREDSGSYTRIGNVSDNMTLYCKKRFVYLDETGCQTTLSKGKERKLSASLSDLSLDTEIDEHGPTGWQTVQTKGKGRKVSKRYSYPSMAIRVDEHGKSDETGCQTTLSKGKERTLSASLSDLSLDTEIDEHRPTGWQTVQTKGKGHKVSKRYSYPSMAIRVDEHGKSGETGRETVQTKGKGQKGSNRYSYPSMAIRVDEHGKSGANVWTKVGANNTKDRNLSNSSSNPEIAGGQPKKEATDLSLHMPRDSPKQVARSSITEAPPLPTGKMYHVFFSYRHCKNESEWVKEIIKRLESSDYNYKCCIDDRDFMPGQSIVDNIEQAIKQSVRVAVVLTPEYMTSFWCQYEATVMRVPGCKANIIPLILKECTIPNSLIGLTYITVSTDNDEWFERFMKALKGNIPYLPALKSEHIFMFHDDASEEDMKRVEKLMSASESSACSFRCISRGEHFVCGKSIKENLHECAEKAVITVFALSSKFPKEKWLEHWQDLNRRGIKLFPLKFDEFQLPEEFKDIVIFDATREQDIWVPKLINKLVN